MGDVVVSSLRVSCRYRSSASPLPYAAPALAAADQVLSG